MSAEPPKLNITQADLDPIQQRAGVVQDVSYVQPGQDNLEVRREDFASGKIPPELYEYSPTEQHLISEWALFSAGLRATPPEQPRPTAKPKLVIKDTPQAKKSDKAAEANGDALLSRIQAPRDKWRRTV